MRRAPIPSETMMSFEVDYKNGQRFVDRLTPQLERQIVKEYTEALREIRATMAEYYAKYPMTYQEMAKYQRLEKLQAEIKVIISGMTEKVQRKVASGLEDIYTNSYNVLGYALENSAQLAWALPPQRAIAEAINNPISGIKVTESLNRNRDYIISEINGEITRGLIRGDSYRNMARGIKKKLEGNVNKNTLRIARTEAHKVQTIAQQDSFDYAESKGVEGKKVWVATLDSRTRPDHQEMDGKEADEDGYFTFPDGVKTQGPGLSGEPHQDIQCRCALLFVVDDIPEIRRTREGIIGYKTYKEWAEAKK